MDPLLGRDLETNKETTAVAMQRRRKHASATIKLLLETVFSTRSVQRGKPQMGALYQDRLAD
jgi:riboflavin synthase